MMDFVDISAKLNSCLSQGQVTETWLDFLVDMEMGDQGDRSVDHLPGPGNDTGTAAEPGSQWRSRLCVRSSATV